MFAFMDWVVLAATSVALSTAIVIILVGILGLYLYSRNGDDTDV